MDGPIAWDETVARAKIAAFVGREGALLPALHEIQSTFGYVPDAAAPLLAEAFNLSRAEVHGVVTFYPDFRRVKPGRRVVRICRGEACQSCGSEEIAGRVLSRFGANWGETRNDITIEAVYCLGMCAAGPAALIDGAPLARLTVEKLSAAVFSTTRAAAQTL